MSQAIKVRGKASWGDVDLGRFYGISCVWGLDTLMVLSVVRDWKVGFESWGLKMSNTVICRAFTAVPRLVEAE